MTKKPSLLDRLAKNPSYAFEINPEICKPVEFGHIRRTPASELEASSSSTMRPEGDGEEPRGES